MQKGQLPFVEAARLVPDVRFMFAGKWLDDSVDELRRRAGDNVEFTGWLSDDDLHAAYRRAAVYVQASRHEGFGLAVAEAMLAGCVPVVMNVTAMPEVVGDAGVLIESQEPDEVAGGVRRALELGPDAARRARERILTSSRRSAAARGSSELWKMRSLREALAGAPSAILAAELAVIVLGAGLFGFAIAELTSDDGGDSATAPAVVGGSSQPEISTDAAIIASVPDRDEAVRVAGTPDPKGRG